jgi:hypothetical protein
MKRACAVVLAAAAIALGLGRDEVQAGWIGPNSSAYYEQRFYYPPPPDDLPHEETIFDSESGGGTARHVSFSADHRYDPTATTWNIQTGATFDPAALAPGEPVVLSLTDSFTFGYFGLPEVAVTLFGTNSLLVESDFTSVHSPQDSMEFTFPQYSEVPPITRSADITSFVEQLSGRYSRVGMVFSSAGGNLGNEVDFNVRLGPVAFIPEPSSLVMGAVAVLIGLGSILTSARRTSSRS